MSATVQRLEELTGQVKGIDGEIEAIQNEANEKIAGLRGKQVDLMTQINNLSSDAMVEFTPSQAATTTPTPKKKAAKKSVATATKKTATKKTATKKTATKKTATKKTATATKTASASAAKPKRRGRRPSGDGMTMRAAVWNVLDRDNYSKYDIPKDQVGLRIAEIKRIIESEKLISSGSKDIGSQVATAVYALRDEGKVVRGDGKCYYIIEGAELDGPHLDESGKPVK